MSFLGALESLLGGHPQPQSFNTGAHVQHSTALSPAQVQAYNSQIEADGARMYNQAHPGQVYHTNQNNEFSAGQLPSTMPIGQANYLGYRQLPSPVQIQSNQPKGVSFSSRLLSNFQSNPNQTIQGIQNPGFTPLQSGRGLVSGGYGLQPSSFQVLTGNPQQIRMQ